jgi:hypothetical protein
MTEREIICAVKDSYDKLIKLRDISRNDILNVFEDLTAKLIIHPRTFKVNCMRVYFRRHKNDDVESIECYELVSLGHIGNNHYKIIYNKNGFEESIQIDKYNLVSVEGI